MRNEGLTPDVPLGPFEGILITAYSAASKDAKLHASRNCTRLKAGTVLETPNPLAQMVQLPALPVLRK